MKQPGSIGYARPDPSVVGREQAERRPVLVVSSLEFARAIPDLVIAVPLSTRDRGLPHHIPVTGEQAGLSAPSWALCEQVRAIAVSRLTKDLGMADVATLRAVRAVIANFLDLHG